MGRGRWEVSEKLQGVHSEVYVYMGTNKRVPAGGEIDVAVDEVRDNLTMGARRATMLLWLVRSIGDGQVQARCVNPSPWRVPPHAS